MNKIHSLVFTMAAALGMAFFPAGCDPTALSDKSHKFPEDDGSGTGTVSSAGATDNKAASGANPHAPAAVGTWSGNAGAAGNRVAVFYSDGILNLSDDAGSQTGTWSVYGDLISYSVGGITGGATISGNAMTMLDTDGTIYVLTRQ